MSEMIERLARILLNAAVRRNAERGLDIPSYSWEEAPEFWRVAFLDDACSVLHAMREPTDDMLNATNPGEEVWDAWPKMIDAALGQSREV